MVEKVEWLMMVWLVEIGGDERGRRAEREGS